MALIQTAFIWVAYAVAVALVALVAAIFTYTYQTPRDRSALVSTITIITLTSLLATVLLLPVDIALVSSTTSSKLGRKKDWATPEAVHNILFQLKIVYYALYSLDAVLCLLVVPFTYFFYEELDDEEADNDRQSFGSKALGALKYTLIFVVLVLILFLVGFFVPVARNREGKHMDLDYFKKLLQEDHGTRALTFSLGTLPLVLLFCQSRSSSPRLLLALLNYQRRLLRLWSRIEKGNTNWRREILDVMVDCQRRTNENLRL
jgi:LMBR1 domain-containing protein 1